MAKEIFYDPKITNARTQYNSISAEDMSWLQIQLIRYLSLMGELRKSRNNDIVQTINQYWAKRTETLPKGKDGWNTPETFVSGLLNNLMFGTQNDLSDPQMDALSNISRKLELIYDAVSTMDLQKNVEPLVEITFRQRLFS